MTPIIEKPTPAEYASFYEPYIASLPEGNILDLMRAQKHDLSRLPGAVHPDRETFAYAPGKWTIRQVVGHLCDAERIFGYRALRISRGDQTPLPGFDENAYVANSSSASTPLEELVEELCLLREANLHLFTHLDTPAWQQVGMANAHRVSVRALCFIIVGHANHHLNLLRDRYEVHSERSSIN